MPKLNPLDYPAGFAPPLRMAESAWAVHVPFGMFLIDLLRPAVVVELGTHNGVSYCAFCQAIRQLGLPTRAYAVDTWKGDAHAGFYGGEVLADLRRHHDALYAGFSTLLQSTFDEAIKYFSDGSIDLLHIDGLHTYEAVKHDFQSWLPKLTDGGVVLFHDINVRERDFGVWRLWEELSAKYASFSMSHGHGLGVLAPGKDHPRALNALLDLPEAERVSFCDLFRQLGRHLEVELEKQNTVIDYVGWIAERDQAIRTLDARVNEREQAVQALNAQVSDKEQTVQALTAQVTEKEQSVQALTAEIAERHQSLQTLTAQLAEIVNSKAWKIALLSRRLRLFIAPPFSLRTRLLRSLFHMFRRSTSPGSILPGPRKAQVSERSAGFDRNDYTEWIRRYDTLTEETRFSLGARIQAFAHRPLISLVMPVCNPSNERLIAAIESVRQQIYPYWELCIADDASTDNALRPILERYAREDARIHIAFRDQNPEISAASNRALALTTGEWVAPLHPDDLLAEHALFWVADAINQNAKISLIYSDEDRIDDAGKRLDPYFKCDWNVDLFYAQNFIAHLAVYKTAVLREIGDLNDGLEGAQGYDLALRYIERIDPAEIHHIPRVLYHARMQSASTTQSEQVRAHAVLAGEQALNGHFQRRSVKAAAQSTRHGHRIRYALPDSLPMVSLIIPTRNGLEFLQPCVDSILQKTTYSNCEILIVDNGSDDVATLQYFNELESEARVRVVRDDRPFNYSTINNAAVKVARGQLVALVNNDIEVISPDWLSEMVSHALRPEVGAVGARLWYPNNTLQHGGVILGINGVAGHAYRYLPRGEFGHGGRAGLGQTLSAVTAACLVIRKEVYEEVGGFNETDLSVAFNDVDFCLRVRAAGYRNLWTPYAQLYHHELATRGLEDTVAKEARFVAEARYIQKRWAEALSNDPAYNPNLTLEHEDFGLAWPPRVLLPAHDVGFAEDSPAASQGETAGEEQPALVFKNNNLPAIGSVPHDRIDKLDIYAANNESRAAEVRGGRVLPRFIIRDRRPGLSVVILNLNHPELIVPLVEQLQRQQEVFRRSGLTLEIVVGDTGSTDPGTLASLRELQQAPDCVVVSGLKYHFSRCNNHLAFAHSSCEMLLFLNNDIIFARDTALLELFQAAERRRDVGVFGALLFFPDGTVQHAGVDFFRNSELRGFCYHPLSRARMTEESFPKVIEAPGATGAFLAIRASLFQELGGFDEQYAAECQDIALCLASWRHGFSAETLNLGATVHMENATRPKNEENWADRRRFLRKWGSFIEARFL